MLTKLIIKNYALIKDLEMDPSKRLTVITGETGAGKSIMLGAVSLLLGARADTKVLFNKAEKCFIEGAFDISSYDLQSIFEEEDLDHDNITLIRREINVNGKSRAFINDTPITLDVLKKIGGRLMDIHSQHEVLDLATRSFQLQLVDAYAQNHKEKELYSSEWKGYNRLKTDYEQLVQESNALKEESDYINFQLQELLDLNLKEGELAELESEIKILEHSEEIKARFNLALENLTRSDSSAERILKEIRNQINAISAYSPSFKALSERIDSMNIELADIISEIEKEDDRVEFEPKRIEEVKGRLDEIYALIQKHRVQTDADLIQLKSSLQSKADKTSTMDDELSKLRVALEQSNAELMKRAKTLSKTRENVLSPLSKKLVELLNQLGIPYAQIKILKETVGAGHKGIDSLEILFSANKGLQPQPLGQVASGGEFSRLMFSVKHVMAEMISLPTLILDEIDSGVSGQIAIQLGVLMKQMAKHHQVITISHLPQIAAKADCHYFVFKDDTNEQTISNIRKLDETERVQEIAKMIGGAQPTTKALASAKELMEMT